MKLLLDQDVYAATVRFLRSLSHDVLTASEAGEATASDSHLLDMARRLGRILVTRDRDFGSLVWVEGLATSPSASPCSTEVLSWRWPSARTENVFWPPLTVG